jgi:small subunit ribosomal protein S20
VAHSLSAKKRIRQNNKKRAINRARKSQIKKQIKRVEAALETGDIQAAKEEFRLAMTMLDKVAASSTMHKRTAARRKSQLAKKLNASQAKKAS